MFKKAESRLTATVHRFGRWFSDQVHACPENSLDGLLWIIFSFHAFLLNREARSIGPSMDFHWAEEHLRDLWRYYWSFQTHDHRAKAKAVILVITPKYYKKV